MSQHYSQSGVSLEAGYESVERIKAHTERTRREGMMSAIGSFGGLFDLSSLKLQEPVLVSGTDGVGTKLKLAFMMDKHDTIGIDAVAMCVNDILAQGAQPLFFLDYIALGHNIPAKVEAIVKGVADGCVQAGCALIGGETAEMPDMYSDGEYDIAGFSVGACEKSALISPLNVQAGQAVIGLPSSGLHSNGFSLVRKILFKDHASDLSEPFDGSTLGEVLLTPTKIYVKPVLALMREVSVKGIAHITGGGFHENMPRCLQSHQGLQLKRDAWTIPAIFTHLQTLGQIPEAEMYSVFNMGIGMILIVEQEDLEQSLAILKAQGENAVSLGVVVDRPGIRLV